MTTATEVSQADRDAADRCGWLTMERRAIVAEEFARHAAQARARAVEWQPIESAPKDGSWFVTVNANSAQPEYEIGRYMPHFWESYVAVGDGLFRKEAKPISEFTHDNFHRATHWLALPPLNNTKGDGE
jgi:hypothetical protein